MTTRDSKGWWVVVTAGFLTALAAQPELIEKVMERDPKAIIAVLAMLLSVSGAKMQTSPLPISDAGRAAFKAKEDAQP
jgi:hypothetical protein